MVGMRWVLVGWGRGKMRWDQGETNVKHYLCHDFHMLNLLRGGAAWRGGIWRWVCLTWGGGGVGSNGWVWVEVSRVRRSGKKCWTKNRNLLRGMGTRFTLRGVRSGAGLERGWGGMGRCGLW